MLSFLARRVFIMIPTLLVTSLIIFAIIQAPEGDYVDTFLSELESRGQHDRADVIRKQYGLDLPFFEQYFKWIGNLVQGDMGFSFEYQRPVNDVVGDRLWLTFIISLATILFTWIVAFPIGVYSAVRQYSIGDYVVTTIGFFGLAVPNFLLALILMHYLNLWFGVEIGGLMDAEYIDKPWTWGKFMSVLSHMIVPTIVIGTSGTAAMIRRLRANLLDELNKQYVVTGRAKGLPPLKLLVKYPLRISLNPFIADIGAYLPSLVSSAAVVSIVMNLPTTGPMLIAALKSQDMYLAGSFLMFLSLLTIVGIFISDLALAALDPRIRLEGKATK
ncbi:MAG TPA: ABC transporter permease [Kiloniellales bacterium]|nr:ABC transporter permease [Kiloniellales bacterium]